MKITVVYDNEVGRVGLRKGHGFSAHIEDKGMSPLLFDTGADGPTLLHNMKELNIDARHISTIVISHAHDDHTGGLSGILSINEVAELYLPSSFRRAFPGRKVTGVKGPVTIREDIFSTGELEGVEQSLAFRTAKGVFVLTGCAHSGMERILAAAARFGQPYGVAGGFHGFHDFKLFKGLSLICPCHCTKYRQEIRDLFGDRTLSCGVGLVIELW
jgi:7,8-dihydropterin-6-yl-methyl-4-(beta-D-ribofuranosyl)aminobenzene 5'-phosphate synthase